MKKKITIALILVSLNLIKAQIKVVDSITKMPIPFTTITFGENNGFYTNQDGEFNLKEVHSESISIFCLGYEKKTIEIKSINQNTIFLKPSSFELSEIIISNKKNKTRIKKIKPEKHNDFLQSYMLNIGGELAIYVPNNFDSNDVVLKSLLIPVVTKTISFDKNMTGKKQQVKKLPFSAMYKISFYENENNRPKEQLNYESITIVLNEESTIVNLNLEKYTIDLPKNGLFVGILNLGPTDETGKLIPTTPYIDKKTEKGIIRIVKHTKPFFPYHYKNQNTETFIRYTFNDDLSWNPFFKHKIKNIRDHHNISLGYEVKIY